MDDRQLALDVIRAAHVDCPPGVVPGLGADHAHGSPRRQAEHYHGPGQRPAHLVGVDDDAGRLDAVRKKHVPVHRSNGACHVEHGGREVDERQSEGI
jgi:hypothetical protein